MEYYTTDGWTDKLPDWAHTGYIYGLRGAGVPKDYSITHIPLGISVRDGWNQIKVWLSYHQCCGLREFGTIEYDDPREFKEFFYKVVKEIQTFGSAGAFTYTQVGYYKKQIWEHQDFFDLLDNVSYSEPWWNPNSGNWVRVLTIPHNQEKAPNVDTSDSEDYEFPDEDD